MLSAVNSNFTAILVASTDELALTFHKQLQTDCHKAFFMLLFMIIPRLKRGGYYFA